MRYGVFVALGRGKNMEPLKSLLVSYRPILPDGRLGPLGVCFTVHPENLDPQELRLARVAACAAGRDFVEVTATREGRRYLVKIGVDHAYLLGKAFWS
jgi:hypothetical protein